MQGMSGMLALPLLRTEEPETVLHNGNIWTVDETQPRAQAVAISGGRFLAVGSNADVLPWLPLARAGLTLALRLSFQDSTTRMLIQWGQASSTSTR